MTQGSKQSSYFAGPWCFRSSSDTSRFNSPFEPTLFWFAEGLNSRVVRLLCSPEMTKLSTFAIFKSQEYFKNAVRKGAFGGVWSLRYWLVEFSCTDFIISDTYIHLEKAHQVHYNGQASKYMQLSIILGWSYHTCIDSQGTSLHLVTHLAHRFWRWSNKHHPGIRTGLGKFCPLRQETIARMDSIHTVVLSRHRWIDFFKFTHPRESKYSSAKLHELC